MNKNSVKSQRFFEASQVSSLRNAMSTWPLWVEFRSWSHSWTESRDELSFGDRFLGETETHEPSILAGLFRAGCEQRPWPRFATWGWGDILELRFWADFRFEFWSKMSWNKLKQQPYGTGVQAVWNLEDLILHQDGQPLDRFCHLAVEAAWGRTCASFCYLLREIQRLIGSWITSISWKKRLVYKWVPIHGHQLKPLFQAGAVEKLQKLREVTKSSLWLVSKISLFGWSV